MKSKKVISKNNLPSRLPIWPTLVWFILMDKFNAPQWLWGAFGLLFLLMWVSVIIGATKEDETDIFKDK